jgi:hypothetical protein
VELDENCDSDDDQERNAAPAPPPKKIRSTVSSQPKYIDENIISVTGHRFDEVFDLKVEIIFKKIYAF